MPNTQILSAQTKQRNDGIDALRLLAMFFVVTLHVIGTGGILENLSGIPHKIVFLMEVIAYCAVNCYAAITGYVAYSDTEKPYRYEKYAGMWLQVFFYSFGVTLVAFLLGWGNVGLGALVYSALPVTTGRYWYFSVYTGLFFMIPYLNRFVRNLTGKQMSAFALSAFLLFSCYECITGPFAIGTGYCLPWLLIMYLLGAWIKKCDIASKVHTRYCLITMVICWLFTWLYTLYSPFKSEILLSYLSPTIVLAALSLLIVFSKLTFGEAAKKLIRFLAPAAFGVYIIHMQPVIKEALLPRIFLWIPNLSWWLIPLATLGCIIAVFVLCLLLERARIWLFSLLKLNVFAERMAGKLAAKIRNFAETYILSKI